MSQPTDRRFEPRILADTRAVILASGMELPCRIVDRSASGLKIRLERANSLPKSMVVIDIGAGFALEATLAWAKGPEAGLKIQGSNALTGLVPSRLTAARDLWRRMTGR